MTMGKVYDGIIGIAVGDAMGVPVEFTPREEIAKSPVTGMEGYGGSASGGEGYPPALTE